MKKFIGILIIFWAGYCLVMTGHEIASISWHYTLRKDPSALQDEGDDIFNQGARAAQKQGVIRDETAGTYIEGDGLRAFSLSYWLYPTKFIPYNSDSTDVVFSHPPHDSVYYVGSQSTYESYKDLIPENYTTEILKTSGEQVFVLIRKS